MGLLKKFLNQTRKPEGFLGKIMVSGMNSGSHAKLASFGLSLLGEEPFGRIADFGCGGGRNVFELATRYPLSSVTGIDYSAVSVEQARKHNRKLGNRVEIFEGDVGNLSLPANEFDLATAFETVYFWPGLERCFFAVAKTLKKGGTFAIHDIFSKQKYGDMLAFLKKLQSMGYEKVELLDTTKGKFMSEKEAKYLMLSSSALLVGKK